MSAERWAECLERLSQGDYSQWPRHEWIRTGNPEFKDHWEPTPNFGMPVWQGEIEPITLLVNADFGMGDTIHFFRFLKCVKQRVSHVVLRCDHDFCRLFSGVEIWPKAIPQIPMCDKIIHMMALPAALGLGKGDLCGKPYLRPNPDCEPNPILTSLKAMRFTKVGVCWAGNPFNPRDGVRSIPEDLLGRLFIREGTRFLSLNKLGPPPEGFSDLRGLMGDWNDTAYLIGSLDLVVSVDTAVAHLAGAMGKPVWLLLPETPDWRWGLEGEHTVWYDSMRIFRQRGAWEELLERVGQEIIAEQSI